jgi:arsenate reductase
MAKGFFRKYSTEEY